MNIQPMLNVYPDSLGGKLLGTIDFLAHPDVQGAFQSVYLLPSVYHTDLDRGFSVIDYQLNQELVSMSDLAQLANLNIRTKLDFILNHASVLSPQFQSVVELGSQSPYYDFFIDWNQFWDGHGTLNDEGIVIPDDEHLHKMFFRKPGLPILTIDTKNGEQLTFWNTFYQEKKYPNVTVQQWLKILNCQYGQAVTIKEKVDAFLEKDEPLAQLDLGHLSAYQVPVIQYLRQNCEYLGQMDLNIQSPLVWQFYAETLDTLKAYGAEIARLDAFAYAPKAVGKRNFLNEPETWQVLERVNKLAQERSLTLLPEIHESYEQKIYEKIGNEGYLVYDFFLPGLVLDTIESANAQYLVAWANEIIDKQFKTVNMLGCHDGIPLLDLKGLLPEQRIQELIDLVVSRGGYVKNLHGQKNVYYQVNATYYSALGEDDAKLILARALQLFMPGKPQIWYLDLFAGTNDYQAVERAGAGGHKEINRTNLSQAVIDEKMRTEIVQKQLRLLQFRQNFAAFNDEADIKIAQADGQLTMTWSYNYYQAQLSVTLAQPASLKIMGINDQQVVVFEY